MSEKEFINSYVFKYSGSIKNFPSDFISEKNFLKELKLPGKTLLIGKEFFGKYEIITPDGNPVLHAESYIHAKFILYSNRNNPQLIFIPPDDEMKQAVKLYEQYLDTIIKEIETDCKKHFPEEKNSNVVANEIFRQLNLVRA